MTTTGARAFKGEKRVFFSAASAAANKGIDYFWQIASTMGCEKTCELLKCIHSNEEERLSVTSITD